MTGKVQKIRKEVERLMNELIREKEKGFGSDVDDACILELQNVLTYIDSLQEEPQVKKLAGLQHVNETCKGNDNSLTQEPVSEGVEEAAHEYADLRRSNYETAFYAFMSGAKWQKEQFEKTLKNRIINAYNRGMEQMKQQMMVKAFPVEIDSSRRDGRCILSGNFARFETGDKVKLVIIKND